MNRKEEVDEADLARIGHVVSNSAWDIYDERKGSVTEEVQEAAVR